VWVPQRRSQLKRRLPVRQRRCGNRWSGSFFTHETRIEPRVGDRELREAGQAADEGIFGAHRALCHAAGGGAIVIIVGPMRSSQPQPQSVGCRLWGAR